MPKFMHIWLVSSGTELPAKMSVLRIVRCGVVVGSLAEGGDARSFYLARVESEVGRRGDLADAERNVTCATTPRLPLYHRKSVTRFLGL